MRPGERVIDIGCGDRADGRCACRVYGARAVGPSPADARRGAREGLDAIEAR